MMPLDAVPAGSSPPVLRCQVRLPMEPKGWDTVLARCDGRAVAIGVPGRDPYAPGTKAAQYARDMQVIVKALSRPPPGVPTWLAVLGTLMGAGALYASIKAVLRHLPRRAVPATPPPPARTDGRHARLARLARRYSLVHHPR
jgi:hypothetical protein